MAKAKRGQKVLVRIKGWEQLGAMKGMLTKWKLPDGRPLVIVKISSKALRKKGIHRLLVTLDGQIVASNFLPLLAAALPFALDIGKGIWDWATAPKEEPEPEEEDYYEEEDYEDDGGYGEW